VTTNIGFKDATNLAASFVITALHALRDVGSELDTVARDLAALAKLEPPNERDFLKRANSVKDPRGEEADIHSDLRLMLRRLDETEVLVKERREFIKKLLD
jgi:hypothetical protein